jgi:hypothetical protein
MSQASSTDIQLNLMLNTEMSYRDLRRLEISLLRIMRYVEQFSGNKDLNKTLQLMEKAIITARTLQIAIRAVEAASGPIGWLYAGTTVVAAGMSGMSLLENTQGA